MDFQHVPGAGQEDRPQPGDRREGDDDPAPRAGGGGGRAADRVQEISCATASRHTLFRDRFAEELGDVALVSGRPGHQVRLDLARGRGAEPEKVRAAVGAAAGPAGRSTPDYPEDERFPRAVPDRLRHHARQEREAGGPGLLQGRALRRPADRQLQGAGRLRVPRRDPPVVHGGPRLVPADAEDCSRPSGRATRSVDEVEDGARARYTEEGLSAFIFAYAKNYNWLEGKSSVSSELLRMHPEHDRAPGGRLLHRGGVGDGRSSRGSPSGGRSRSAGPAPWS